MKLNTDKTDQLNLHTDQSTRQNSMLSIYFCFEEIDAAEDTVYYSAPPPNEELTGPLADACN